MTDNIDFSVNFINQALDLWILPEIKRRQEKGDIPEPYYLEKAAVFMYPDERNIEVLLNDEFQAICRVKLKEGVKKNIGESIKEEELEGIESIKLVDEIDQNCGYVIIIRIGNYWKSYFDFRYNKGLSRHHIETGDEFLSIARHALMSEYWKPFVDNLYNAAELYLKAIFLTMRDEKMMKKATHKLIQLRLNQFSSLGNIEVGQKETFNKLHGLRPLARYCKGDFSLSKEEAEKFVSHVQGLRDHAARFAGVEKNN